MEATDSLGVPLTKPEMTNIWRVEQRHVHCIQDIPGIQLYTHTGYLKKAYLLDGVFRWNADRAIAAQAVSRSTLRTFDIRLKNAVNALSMSVHKRNFVVESIKPRILREEKLGVEYLLEQSGIILPSDDDHLNREIDEGFEDGLMEEISETPDPIPYSYTTEEIQTIGPIVQEDEENDDDFTQMEVDDSESTDAWGIPGWDKVDSLAQALINLKGISVTTAQAITIKRLYHALFEYDRRPLIYEARIHKPSTGRFARSKSSTGNIGIEAVKRCFLSGGSPASIPSKSRIVEAILYVSTCVIGSYIQHANLNTYPDGD